jgi:energy-coupling factor transporter ATP-binding protein EcfA2
MILWHATLSRTTGACGHNGDEGMVTRHSDTLQSDLLKTLYFGKDDAESDIGAGGLLKAGFLRTSVYEEVKDGRKSLVIGRKGSGKTAIAMMLMAGAAPSEQVCLVSPDEISAEEIRRFELPGVTPEQAKALFWRYVLAVHVAKHAIVHARIHCPEGNLPDAVRKARRFLVDNGEMEDLTLTEKFWRIIDRIRGSISLEAFGVKFSAESAAPSAGVRLHDKIEIIEERVLAACRQRPCFEACRLVVLVDQLDKVWSDDPDSDAFVIGLLQATKHAAAIYPDLRCVTFLRTDMYELLEFQDRDKFRGEEIHIDWNKDLLLDLLLARAEASLGAHLEDSQLWGDIFADRVSGKPVEQHIVDCTLMRPRDAIQYANACRDAAYMQGNKANIREEDIWKATLTYSNWKWRDLLEEWRYNHPFLEDLALLFQNSSYLQTRVRLAEQVELFRDTWARRNPRFAHVFEVQPLLEVLYSVGMLGVVRNGKAVYAYQDERGVEPHEDQFVVHPAFRQALRATCALARPYDAQRLVALRSSSARRIGVAHARTRGSYWHRQATRIAEIAGRVEMATVTASIPDEVRDEVQRSLRRMRLDAERLAEEYDGGPLELLELQTVFRGYFLDLKARLDEVNILDPRSDLVVTLQDILHRMYKMEDQLLSESRWER